MFMREAELWWGYVLPLARKVELEMDICMLAKQLNGSLPAPRYTPLAKSACYAQALS